MYRDFYITAATVIPVFYLALTFQGNLFRDQLRRWRDLSKEQPKTFWANVRLNVRGIGTGGIVLLLLYAIIVGVIGEYSALQALANGTLGRDATDTLGTVWAGVISLLIAVAVGPIWWFVVGFFGPTADDFRGLLASSRAGRAALQQDALPTLPEAPATAKAWPGLLDYT